MKTVDKSTSMCYINNITSKELTEMLDLELKPLVEWLKSRNYYWGVTVEGHEQVVQVIKDNYANPYTMTYHTVRSIKDAKQVIKEMRIDAKESK